MSDYKFRIAAGCSFVALVIVVIGRIWWYLTYTDPLLDQYASVPQAIFNWFYSSFAWGAALSILTVGSLVLIGAAKYEHDGV
jgi:hypothetical protein